MPDGSPSLTLTLHQAIGEISPADWDACAGVGNPFVSHAFLSAVEDSGSATARTGWLPQHAVLRDAKGRVAALSRVVAVASSSCNRRLRPRQQAIQQVSTCGNV